ncbi:hypothetical protein B0T26DRAFT_267226 [Lasiosphaeria miniovina]|uniref:Uncharacterized protein n=1 Tax=Lasiosphaeria miniovina TaxID=1954250 RepID=A0AA40DV74_9PEZI|nr:uncharacterized protein B0T26DRAFT_267226 [Lasiosphaeria miniovina]KAK0716795.1 hypothetical protein B0T26DRAFT_267226 [Lasiosphaeria miniovina]
MVGMHNAASMVARCASQIEQLTQQVEKFNGIAFDGGVVRAGAAVYGHVSGEDRASLEAAAQTIRIGIANACHFVRAAKGFATDVKKELEPKILKLHSTVIQARLALASDAYLRESVRGIETLKLLEKIEKPTPDDLAITINAFGNLMQTTMPLFRATLAVSDDELRDILPTLVIAGATAATAIGAGGLVYFGVASLFGPVGIIGAAASAAGLAFGSMGAKKGAEWMESQQNNPSVVLLDVQKTLEECAAYLLGLLVISTEAEGGDDAVFLERVQQLRSQVSSDLVLTPEYVKAYFRQATKKLEGDMGLLKVRLEKYSAKLAAKQLKDIDLLSLSGVEERTVVEE